MELKNTLIALMLLLGSMQTHKAMVGDEISLDSFLRDDSRLPLFTGTESMFTGSLAPEYQEYYNALTNYNTLVPAAQLEFQGSVNVIPDAVSAFMGNEGEQGVSSSSSTKKRKRNIDMTCGYCGRIISRSGDFHKHITVHSPVDICCPIGKCRRELRAAHVNTIEAHLGQAHKKDCKMFCKPIRQLAHEIYKAALEVQEGKAASTAQLT